MDYNSAFKEIIELQKTQQKRIQEVMQDIDNSKIISENKKLIEKNKVLEEEICKIKKVNESYKKENEKLKNAIIQQVHSERNSLLLMSKKNILKLQEFYKTSGENKIIKLEQQYKSKISSYEKLLNDELVKNNEKISNKLKETENIINETLLKTKKQFSKGIDCTVNDIDIEYDELKNIEIPADIINKKVNENNLEIKVGTKVINIIGILLVVFGVSLGLKYTYSNFMTNELKGISAFLLGIIFLCVGEFMNRKKSSPFYIGITSCGISILFVSTGICYFGLNILSMYLAVIVCILITVLSFFLSIRYNSKVVAMFAFVGGYLPLTTISSDKVIVISGLIYFFLLNILALGISLAKDWDLIKIISFIFNTVATSFILFFIQRFMSPYFIILYCILNFAIYVFVVLIYPIRKKIPINKICYIILFFNILVNCISIFLTININNLSQFNGLTALILCLYYFLFGVYLKRKLVDNDFVIKLFFSTACILSILVYPLQFEFDWLLLCWIIQACVYIILGLFKDDKLFEWFGFFVFGLCILWLFLPFNFYTEPRFIYKFTYVIVGTVIILTAILYRYRNNCYFLLSSSGVFYRIYKYFTVGFTYFYFLYIFSEILDFSRFVYSFIYSTFMYSFILYRIKYLKDKIIDNFCILLNIIVIIFVIIINLENLNYTNSFEFALTIGYNLYVIYSIFFVLSKFIKENIIQLEWLPLSIALFINITVFEAFIVNHIQPIVLSLILIVSSLIMIIIGFKFGFSYLRKFALVFSIIILIKLFFIDLAFLKTIEKIIAFFGFGFTLIAISYVYQKFLKKLKIDVKKDAE